MIKICIISPAAYPLLKNDDKIKSSGGAEAQLTTLGQAFSNNGFEVHFIVDDYGQANKEKVGRLILHKVAFRYLGGQNYFLLSDWFNLVRTLMGIGADIHLIKVPRNLLLPLGLYCRIAKCKLMLIGQTDKDVDPDYLKMNENVISYWFFRIGLLWVDYVLAQNEKQKIGYLKSYKKRAEIIRSVVTLPESEATEKSEYVLWVGTQRPLKQPELFIDLAKKLPEINFKMIMAPSQKNCKAFSLNSLSKIPNLEYLGFVPFSSIPTYFKRASLLVNTSKIEGFPNTFLQAWQYGTPVVSVNVDPDDIIKKYNLGRQSGSFKRLCDDVKVLMEDPKLRKASGIKAKKYVDNNHSIDVIIPRYLELFHELQKKG